MYIKKIDIFGKLTIIDYKWLHKAMMMTISQEVISKLLLAEIFWNVKLHLFIYWIACCVVLQLGNARQKDDWEAYILK